MKIDLRSLINVEKLTTDFEYVEHTIKEYGEAVILMDNKPKYVILEYIEKEDLPQYRKNKLNLWDAMIIILSEQPQKKMHASEIAIAIDKRGLYFMKDGSSVKSMQIRARAGHKPEIFEALPGNFIKLKDGYEKI